MSQFRPIELNRKTGLISLALLLGTVLSLAPKSQEILTVLIPNGVLLNWNFVGACVIVTNLITGFVMHEIWRREFVAHQKTQYERDNLENLLNISEEKRMTDVITGIPNGTKLTTDIDTFFSRRQKGKEAQVIFIDLKNFGRINLDFGYLKGDEILRMIAQDIYQSMRRNENMYRHLALPNSDRVPRKKFYRRYSGGDEFVFLLEGDQSEAIGFVNRLVPRFKEQLSQKATKLLKTKITLSFRCAIAPVVKHDSAKDVFDKVDGCYKRAAEGTEDFTICWAEPAIEYSFADDDKRKASYAKAREIFKVMSLPSENETEVDPIDGTVLGDK